MKHRGSDVMDAYSSDHVAVVVSRFEWECVSELQGPARVARDADHVAIVDGNLYYHADLRRALVSRGERADGEHSAELILAAYRAFGENCLSVLEGDFAFVIWDGRRRRMVLGRDHAGRRPLHYHVNNDLIVVASTARAVATHDDVRSGINDVPVVAAVGALLGGSLDTGFADVHPVPASTLLSWEPHRGLREAGRWSPPAFSGNGISDVAEGGRELRHLLGQAAAERCAGSSDVSMWLSGGADSPSVLGAFSCTDAWQATQVHPITISYPVGDTAREDEHVQEVADALGLSVTWQDSEAVNLLGDGIRLAAERDDPYAHTFEVVNRTLARRSRQTGSRIVLDGYGGDQLFDVSDVFLADLFVRGRWRQLADARRAKELTGVRSLVRTSLLPLLPESWRYQLSRARGYSPDQIRWQTLPSWIAPGWRSDPRIEALYAREPRRRLLESPAAYESRWYVEAPYFPRAISWTTSFGLSEGIDLRSPLYDRRVLCFAASRPLEERGSAGPSKPLLREAMRGVLPASYLAPRSTKTGIPGDYLRRKIRADLPSVVESLGDPRSWHLTQRGLVEPDVLREALHHGMERADHQLFVHLFLTVQAELWLRSNAGS